eukprot:COSAG06_NODE_64532_length_259_cov_0.650000_1_plen_57_part_10
MSLLHGQAEAASDPAMAAVRLHAVTLLACCLRLLGGASGLPRSQSPTISWTDAASVI